MGPIIAARWWLCSEHSITMLLRYSMKIFYLISIHLWWTMNEWVSLIYWPFMTLQMVQKSHKPFADFCGQLFYYYPAGIHEVEDRAAWASWNRCLRWTPCRQCRQGGPLIFLLQLASERDVFYRIDFHTVAGSLICVWSQDRVSTLRVFAYTIYWIQIETSRPATNKF